MFCSEVIFADGTERRTTADRRKKRSMFSVAQTMQNIWNFMIGKSSLQEIATLAIIREISDSNLETGGYSPKSGVSRIIWESCMTALPSGRPFSVPNWLLPAILTLLLRSLPSIHHFHIAHKMPCLPTKFCKRNWTQMMNFPNSAPSPSPRETNKLMPFRFQRTKCLEHGNVKLHCLYVCTVNLF